MRVPVDDDVYFVLDGCLDDGCDALEGKLGVLQIVVVDGGGSHCGTYHVGVPLLSQPLYGSFVVEAWPQVMPSETDASKHHWTA